MPAASNSAPVGPDTKLLEAIAKANGHPAPEEWAQKVVSAYNGTDETVTSEVEVPQG